ncbi:hypothetical protein DUI87_35113 [Hirundo rustica rustica]|uniref:HSF-type DNA-binding domain-containing protein n=1 Tax=Hirundo rustica rustica TaxID=333673 RepID=A0A3M0IIE4_HIRRU|nr:hypothetical protein DUI87_35113 [Hirundo rustica rustica]
MDAMAQLPLPAGLGAGTFPPKLWSLANDPRVRSLRWDSEARGLLVDRSLFERELLRPGFAQGPAPHAFRATQFRSFVRVINKIDQIRFIRNLEFYCETKYQSQKATIKRTASSPGSAPGEQR